MMKNKGFTLVEILIVMAVILILASGSYISFVGFNRSQNLNIARDNLRNSLNEARSSAVSQVIQRCNASQTLVGYQIRFGTNYYDIEEVCQSVNPPYSRTNPRIKRVPIPTSDINFNPVPSTPILFLRLSGGTGEAANRNIVLRNTQGQTRVVTVNPAGVISSN